MSKYSPFDKTLSELSAVDLAALLNVSEGWYVEYKRERISAQGIAKSVSAFSNSYGGWLFLGVDQSVEGERKAGAFPGIPLNEVGALAELVAQAVATQITPTPHFEMRTISGPADQIGLSADRAVVVVQVSQGNNAPYLHSSGRIYRRVGDASDPKYETDRHFVDLLSERAKQTRKRFWKFVSRKPELSKAETGCYLKMLLCADPWEELTNDPFAISFKTFADLMRETSSEAGALAFDNVFSVSGGLMARHVFDNDAGAQLLSWTYTYNGDSEILIPLSWVEITPELEYVVPFLNGYEQALAFVEVCRKKGPRNGRLVDLSQLLFLLIQIMKKNLKLLELGKWKLPIHFKAQIFGAWRCVPFVDLKKMVEFANEYRVPLTPNDSFFTPPGKTPDDCILLDATEEQEATAIVHATKIIAVICEGFGLPESFFISGPAEDDLIDNLSAMEKMGQRASLVSSERSKCKLPLSANINDHKA